MIKILFDFVPSDTPKTSSYYNNDSACREEINYYIYGKFHYQDIFDFQYCITIGSIEEKNRRLQKFLNEIANKIHYEVVYIHFLGHGVKDLSGLQFVKYEDLCKWLLPLKKSNLILINMMASCYTIGMTKYRDCYDKLWFSYGEIQDYCASFDFARLYLQEDGSANFEAFKEDTKQELFGEDKK